MASSSVNSPPTRYKIQAQDGYLNRIWSRWFLDLYTGLGGTNNIGTFPITVSFPLSNPGTPGILYIPIPVACKLKQVTATNQQNISGNEQFNINNAFGAPIATIHFPFNAAAGSVVINHIGDLGSGGATFEAGQTLAIQPLGSSSSFCEGTFIITLEY